MMQKSRFPFTSKGQAKEQHFDYWSSSQSHSEDFETELKFAPHCKLKTAPSTDALNP